MYELSAIGHIRSAFSGKFGTPRQPGLVPSATAELILAPPFDSSEALRDLEGFSHVWVLFYFDRSAGQSWSPTVRPPRLGGNARTGVFATRSPFRPNPIGLSLVELLGVIDEPGRRGLRLGSHDLVDGTPVLDIKPYLPYADAPASPRVPAAYAQPPERHSVSFAPEAAAALEQAPVALRALIAETLALDPRPAYGTGEREHGLVLLGYNVRWRMQAAGVYVLRVARVQASQT